MDLEWAYDIRLLYGVCLALALISALSPPSRNSCILSLDSPVYIPDSAPDLVNNEESLPFDYRGSSHDVLAPVSSGPRS